VGHIWMLNGPCAEQEGDYAVQEDVRSTTGVWGENEGDTLWWDGTVCMKCTHLRLLGRWKHK
jgi:hypothetical protein